MSRYRKLTQISCATALAFGLAACSSSSDKAATTPEPEPEPDPQMVCEDAGGQWADGMCTSAELAALKAQIAALRQQLGIDDSTDIGATVAELQKTLKDLQDKAADETIKANAKAAAALFDGIEDSTNLTVSVTAVTDKDDGGGMASVTATGLTPGVGGDEVKKSAEPMLGKWQGTMLSDAIAAGAAENANTSSTVVVYTDIEAPKSVPFGDVYELDGNGNLSTTNTTSAANRSKVKASAFVHTGRKNHDPDATKTDDVVMIRGTFNGASGEYRCTASSATACASHDAGKGVVRLEGNWVFDPDSGAMAMQADASYAYFGWWLNKGTSEGVEAGTFHGVTDVDGEGAKLAAPIAETFNALGGTATYTGSAAGKYAIKPSLSAATGGHWTADATLTADFGAESGENAGGTISGTISNFMSGDTSMDWSVSLGKTALSGTGTFNSGANSDNDTKGDDVVWTIGGVAGAEAGAWSGGLRGPGKNNVPTVVTGQFSAEHGEVGHMIGAFGADL